MALVVHLGRSTCHAISGPLSVWADSLPQVDLDVAESRDPKGLYKKARSGALKVRVAHLGRSICHAISGRGD